MKNLRLLFILLGSVTFSCLYAQPPKAFTYQAVVRDIGGNPIPNQAISLRFTISGGPSDSTLYYVETQSTTSNQFGLISVAVGRGTPAFQVFDSIPWAIGDKYLGTEIDITNGSNYVNMGTEQLLSVPYALYAGGAPAGNNSGANASGTTNYLSKFISPSSLGNSLIYDDGTNVGIGTTHPGHLFEIRGTTKTPALLASDNLNGIGVVGMGNNVDGVYLPVSGAGGAFYGTATGVYGSASANMGVALYGQGVDSSISYGVIGAANNESPIGLGKGAGGSFAGVQYGVIGVATSTTISPAAGGVFVSYTSPNNSSTTYVEAWMNNSHYKIIGGGAVSSSVPDGNGNRVVLHAPETPEYYFQDYGEGKLVNGKTHINLDPIYARNVVVNDKHPLRVFVQLQGDCNGVYVTNQTPTGFDVVELKGGTSNTAFSWSITCNVADEQMGDKVSNYADLRFEKLAISKPYQVKPTVIETKK